MISVLSAADRFVIQIPAAGRSADNGHAQLARRSSTVASFINDL
jgi:hypothetical protein